VGQVAAIELDLGLSDTSPDPASATTANKESLPNDTDKYSLLLTNPFNFDQHLESVRQASNNHQDSMKTLPSHAKPIQTISPEHLRILGRITSELHKRTQAIRTASQAIEARLDMQLQEFQRQIKVLKIAKAGVYDLKEKSGSIVDRGGDLLDKQDLLAKRLDDVVVAMAAERKPDIGEEERKWFDELGKLSNKVRGGPGKDKGLIERMQAVCPASPMRGSPLIFNGFS